MLPPSYWRALLLGLLAPSLLYGLFFYPVPVYGEEAITLAGQPTSPIYIAPQPDAQLVSPATTIAIRYGVTLSEAVTQMAHFTVTGSKSGMHSGRTILASDQQTLIFVPHQPFQLQEEITVRFRLDAEPEDEITFHFTTTATDPAIYKAGSLAASLTDITQPALPKIYPQTTELRDEDSYTLPADFPQITVTTPLNGLSTGYLFIGSFQVGCAATSYLLILDNLGQPIFHRALPPCVWTTDFKRQPNGLLTYWDSEMEIFHALDNTYTEVDTFQAGNGYETDPHELQILSNQHALLMIYDTQVISNSDGVIPNGMVTATVAGLIVQELDVEKNVVFEWRSWDHFQITDTVDLYLQAEPVDYVHGNAIELDTDGNLLISSRHLNEITKINRQTGQVMWRMGGKQNQFTFIGDDRNFSHQHDIRRLPNGNISLYDNGNFLTPSYSRAVEYRLDERKKTATFIREYRNTPDTYGFAMGSSRLLPNNHTLVGWGASSDPAVTEFAADGTKVFELALAAPNFTYRAFRAEWQGYPTTEPTLLVMTDTAPSLYYSWNGATEIIGYRVYAGKTSEPDTLIDTTFKTSFESKTSIEAALDQFCYFRVMPIDKQGRETRYSNTVFIDSPGCQPTIEREQLLYLPLVIQ